MSLQQFMEWMQILDNEFKLWYEEQKPKDGKQGSNGSGTNYYSGD